MVSSQFRGLDNSLALLLWCQASLANDANIQSVALQVDLSISCSEITFNFTGIPVEMIEIEVQLIVFGRMAHGLLTQ